MQTGGQHDDPKNQHGETNRPDGRQGQERGGSAQDDARADHGWSPNRRSVAGEDDTRNGGANGGAQDRGDGARSCASTSGVDATDERLRQHLPDDRPTG